MLRQIGVEGMVTALHDVPNGEVWSREQIADLKVYIEQAGLRWSVAESLPVSEEIKYAGPRRDLLIENYKTSLRHLGEAGIRTVCYNFMPVIDWIRTDLEHPWVDGGLLFTSTGCGLPISIAASWSVRERKQTIRPKNWNRYSGSIVLFLRQRKRHW